MQNEFQHEFFQDLPGCLCQGGTLWCAEVKGVKSGIILQGDMLCGCMEDIALCRKASSLIKLSLGMFKGPLHVLCLISDERMVYPEHLE